MTRALYVHQGLTCARERPLDPPKRWIIGHARLALRSIWTDQVMTGKCRSSFKKAVHMGLLHDGSIAVAAGIIAAFLSYLFGRIFFRPRLKYSEKIRLRRYDGQEVAQIKFLNGSYWRSIVSLEISPVVIIPFSDVAAGGGRSYLRIRLTPSAQEAPRLGPRLTRVIALDAADLTPFAKQRLQSIGQGALAQDEHRKLTDLMELSLVKPEDKSPDADHRPRLVITVNCKDSITGRDFALTFNSFHREDFQPGSFAGRNDSVHARILRAILSRPIRSISRWWQRRQQLPFQIDVSQGQRDSD
jgi:hypothetical protein